MCFLLVSVLLQNEFLSSHSGLISDVLQSQASMGLFLSLSFPLLSLLCMLCHFHFQLPLFLKWITFYLNPRQVCDLFNISDFSYWFLIFVTHHYKSYHFVRFFFFNYCTPLCSFVENQIGLSIDAEKVEYFYQMQNNSEINNSAE